MGQGVEAERERAADTVRAALEDAGVEWEQSAPYTFVAVLPGTRKLKTALALTVGAHSLAMSAFVIRHADENHAAFHRWLLERNVRMYGVAFAVDKLGDVYLNGRLPLAAVSAEEIDRILGVVLQTADDSFNTLLEIGFATSIRREWDWRVERGESLRNLEAFARFAAPENRAP
ncbi:YbjN domain-containing protein [Embleya scabrispora]|uniref:YbjN domain-containing protein n=1 Tax=Embleya scabrispora TaxID=159449 RepID=A0A1T3NY79_9ACTN|nr:YbjN domain-containing protein [Embleya scabrispora]OPC81705.1 YbjN domain-containing protein [Embleya scabrispora]